MNSTSVAIVGFGKIARDQHVPALHDNAAFTLDAVASRNASLEGVAHFRDIQTLLDERPDIQAISLCAPPQVRYRQARAAIAAGKHVMLEKPPGATLSEVEDLRAQAERAGVTLFATWHSRYAAGVAQAREWLSERRVSSVNVQWKEDVRRWHPGQEWIWEAGGLGVFDPGINALSIITAILPEPFFLTQGELEVPANRQGPIAATLAFRDAYDADIRAEFDWRQTGPQTWDIHIETDAGPLSLTQGGSRLSIGDEVVMEGGDAEYPGLYARFAELIAHGESDVDVAPLRHVADAFLLGQRVSVDAFHE
ncbi:Gfo/Idh/MocA family oxidoreductase [Chromohalobacter canadensis]|uniref:Gfo/Idh/MocA family oxidoreductase n=1 Tax=Chromohalobacter moromii TaxID=2860329 RepID=A0A9X2X0C8_9GAMM|nr:MULTISPECIES: Gfo/Idh/MocA family oxidoreductase [Chromohalobacter]MCT8467484.1 Gfo/Idh/MocA family oxidoreductase [Chromohalobacter canadensis]MCT8470768.1 Gfo/Idh/MocA family oxidoreductase [Chromohalobacter canadensis]MCT8497981.1 Gfo/Idh/MocA family oxidoreductase [Chromohalobacter canadensis]MCT8504335.1 Gfo/Idh/MocA family oxidoreductase [Chromohalobacter moromii]